MTSLLSQAPVFWLIAFALATAVGVLMALAVMRGSAAQADPAEYDLQVYRDQLAEVDRDAARGVLAAEEAERVRTEVARRILAADRAAGAATRLRAGGGTVLAGILAAGTLVASFGLYLTYGAPGYGDLPLAERIAAADARRADRPSQADAQATVRPLPPGEAPAPDYVALVDDLRAAVSQRPGDLEGHRLLMQAESRLGNFSAAASAQERVIRILGDDVTADDIAVYADLLVLAAGGYVSPEAEAALSAALSLDAGNGTARYYWGLMNAQTGRPDVAFRVWDALLRAGPEDAPWITPILAQIEEMAVRAGVNYQLPEIGTGRGPSAADIEAADDLSPAERMEMIAGMVNNLGQRLATEGGPATDWAQLITALGVLGRRADAEQIAAEARVVFAGDPGALDLIARAAERAGVQ
ncbi:MAG: c-type cytochrome biogenesis protein CcmI [Pseudomonadota bacterium]